MPRRSAGLLRLAGAAVLWIAVGGCGEADSTGPARSEEPDAVVSSVLVSSRLPGGSMVPAERPIGVLGTQVRVGATALNEDGETLYTSMQDPDRFSWTSSAPDVATVQEEICHSPTARPCDLVTSVSDGESIIAASSQGVTGSMTVTVRDRAQLAWSVPIPGGIGVGNVIGVDGTIIAAAGGELVAIAEHNVANGGFEGSPWPQIRRDWANTGRAGG